MLKGNYNLQDHSKLIEIKTGDEFYFEEGRDKTVYLCISERNCQTLKHSENVLNNDSYVKEKLKNNSNYKPIMRVERLWYLMRGFKYVQ